MLNQKSNAPTKNQKFTGRNAGFLAGLGLTIGTTVMVTGITTGIIDSPLPIAGIENRAQAQNVSVNVNIDFAWVVEKMKNTAQNFWKNYYGSNFTQTYFGHFPPEVVAAVKKQYGSSANSFFHNKCKEGAYRAGNVSGWQKAIIDPFAWFFFVHREEGGRVNCYVRYSQN